MILHLRRVIRLGFCALLAHGWIGTAGRATAADSARAIEWRTDYHQARAEARTLGRPLWVQFTGPWCGYCQLMEQQVFTHPEVVTTGRDHFVPVKVRSDLHEELVADFEVSGLPSTVIVSPSGAILARHEGYTDVATFHRFLKETTRALTPAPVERPEADATRTSATTRRTPEAAEAGPLAGQGPASQPALFGYCPVTLMQRHRLVSGRPDLTAVWEGREYRFATPEARAAFLSDPETFAPLHDGRCLVRAVEDGQRVVGHPRHGVIYQGRLFLCADAAAQKRFLADPRRYAESEPAQRGFCPHCLAQEGQRVPGLPQYSLTHQGRRYYFPDMTHLEAFAATPEKFLR